MSVVTHIFHDNSIPQISTLFNIAFVNFCLRKIVKELTDIFAKTLAKSELTENFHRKIFHFIYRICYNYIGVTVDAIPYRRLK